MVFSPAAKVGATTLVAIAAIAGGLSWLTNFSLRPSGYNFVVKFSDVAGLLPGANVRFMGLRVGRVERLDPRGSLVEVTVHVNDSGVQLPKDGRYKIMSLGIIGEKALEIFPAKAGHAPAEGDTGARSHAWLSANDAVRGEDPSRLELVMDEVTDAFSSFRKAADPKKFEELFARTAENLADTTETVNMLSKQASGLLRGLEGTPQNVALLIHNLNDLSARADGLVAATSPAEIKDIIRDIRRLSGGLVRAYETTFGDNQMAANQKTIRDIRHLISQVDQLAATLNSTAGDPEVQRDIKDTVRSIRDLTRGISGATAMAAPKNFQSFSLEPTVQAVAMNSPVGTGLAANLGVKAKVFDLTVGAGIEQIGEGNFFNLSAGDDKIWGPAGYHFGLIRSKIGAGVDYHFNENVTLLAQLYNPFQPEVRLGLSYFPLAETQYGLMAQWARNMANDTGYIWAGLEWRPATTRQSGS